MSAVDWGCTHDWFDLGFPQILTLSQPLTSSWSQWCCKGNYNSKSWSCLKRDLCCEYAAPNPTCCVRVWCVQRAQWSGSAGEAFRTYRYSAGSYLPSDSTSPSNSVTASSSASLEAKLFLSFAHSSCRLSCLYSWPQVFPLARSWLTLMPLQVTVPALWAALCPVHIQPHSLVSRAAFASCFFFCNPWSFKGISGFTDPDSLLPQSWKTFCKAKQSQCLRLNTPNYFPLLAWPLYAIFPTVPPRCWGCLVRNTAPKKTLLLTQHGNTQCKPAWTESNLSYS